MKNAIESYNNCIKNAKFNDSQLESIIEINMSEDNKIIFSMVGVSKVTPAGKPIIKNIYLSFFYGAKIGIIGLNGSGKSTVMKIIAGLDNAYQGEVVSSKDFSINVFVSLKV